MNAAQRRGDGGPVPRTALAAILVAAVVGLPAAVAASESNAPRIRFNPADQKAARAAVLRRADLGTAGWTGGAVKPDLSSTLSCPGYTPKQSDLVVTWAAEAHFRHTGLQLQSIAQVMKTRSMVARDWKRSVVDPRAFGCIRHMLTKGLRSNQRLVSFRKVAFPQLARYTAAFRALIAVRANGQRVLLLADVVVFGRSRTELTLTVAAPAAIRSSISRAEVRLARGLLARVRA
jgi:hypothetical protein